MHERRPIILDSAKLIPRDAKRLDTLPISREELFIVRNPKFKNKPFKKLSEWKVFLKGIAGKNQWVYWSSEKLAVQMLNEELYFELRTARNRNLITEAEQREYRNIKIGIAGLSVGSSILSALVLSGGPKSIKIADFDVLAPTNLNRIRSGIADLGSKKIELSARDVWKVDPFADLKLYPNGLTEKTLEKFMLGKPRLDIFIDEMDSLVLKLAARLLAKRERIPVVMATDNGDGILLDVERFDEEPARPVFHGLAGNLSLRSAREAKGKRWFAIIQKIIGEQWMPERHHASLREVGKTIAGIPQLGTDAMAAGVAVALAVRKIAHGDALPSGRYLLDMHKILGKSILRR